MPIIEDPASPRTTDQTTQRRHDGALPRLSRSCASGVAVPPAPSKAGILHLGLGNFHRAHQAVYTTAAVAADGGDWGILGVASRSRSIVDGMHAQDLLYSVAEISPDGTSLTVPGIHTDAFVAREQPARVVQSIADPGIRIVTLTVTENGYSCSPSTGGLDLADRAIASDLRGGDPQSTIGQLARGLQRRAERGGAPVTVLSCDNLAANGPHTRRLVREFLHELPGGEGADALAYLDQAVAFPSSMVDRIVPSTTDGLRSRVSAQLGARDDVPVPAEPFSMWAIEDDFAAGRPAWDAGGAVFSAEVDRFEQMKVRLLNGTHSLIAYLGALQGVETISRAVARDEIERAARSVLAREYAPSVQVPTGVDLEDYERQLFRRWGNGALGHRTSQVGTDGSVKLRQRIPEPAMRLLEAGEMPHMIALTVAGYLSCIAPLPGSEPGPFAQAMRDAARERFAALPAPHSGAENAERAIVDLQLFGEDLAERSEFVARVGELVDIIARRGVTAAIAEGVAA